MAEKAKFDREAAFKSIIGAGRQSEMLLLLLLLNVNWKAHHGPGINNPFERAGK